jgi:DNA (cytosine-5)-methyltransferase 1
MRELSLFSGAGGGLLGSLLLGWEPIGYVEFNSYCQQVIAQRIADGILPNAPIFGDIRTFVSEGYAAAYTGLVDVISGGFPCQPFSVAGKRAGADDERNMWPATIAAIRIIRPRFCFLENVPGLIATGYFNTVIGDLAESGYSVRWRCLSAAEVGARHKRDRLWIVAHAANQGLEGQREGLPGQSNRELTGMDSLPVLRGVSLHDSPDARARLPMPTNRGVGHRPLRGFRGWEAEPNVGRVAHGVASRVDRLKAIGNGQVSIVAATAWRLLTEAINA